MNKLGSSTEILKRIEEIPFKQNVIYKLTFSFLTANDAVLLIEELGERLVRQPRPYCTILDIRDSYFNFDFQERVKKLVETTSKQEQAKGAFAISNDPLQKVISKKIKSDLIWVQSVTEAIEMAQQRLK